MSWKIIKSKEDASVNFIQNYEKGFIEARYVNRKNGYFICYLSSHSGCNKACRFCHLTSTRQNSFEPINLNMYLEQARIVIDYYNSLAEMCREKLVHFNWMARGEPLSNPTILYNNRELLDQLDNIAASNNLKAKYKISTIIPKDIPDKLINLFDDNRIDFYYSIYSIKDSFRKRWLPNALPVFDALCMLKDWQNLHEKEIILHWAFISGENDSIEDVKELCYLILKMGIKARVNIVRYNPPNEKSGESEFSVIERNFQVIKELLSDKSKIIPRVGFDVKASCGMFIQ